MKKLISCLMVLAVLALIITGPAAAGGFVEKAVISKAAAVSPVLQPGLFKGAGVRLKANRQMAFAEAALTFARLLGSFVSGANAPTAAGGNMGSIVSLSPRASSLAIDADGSVWSSYETGNGISPPEKVFENATGVWCKDFVQFIKDSDGTVWGRGGYSLDPVGAIINPDYPYSSAEFIPVLGNVKLFDTWESSLAVLDDNSLWVWGSIPTYGQSTIYQGHCAYKPFRVMDDVQQIAAGSGTSLAIRADGSLWSWYGSIDESTGAVDCTVFKIMDDVAFAAQDMAVKQDGSLWRMVVDEAADTPLVAQYIMEDVVEVSQGGSYFTALDSDGRIWAWPMSAAQPKPEVIAQGGDSLVESWFSDTIFYIDSNGTLQAIGMGGRGPSAAVAVEAHVLYAVTSGHRIVYCVKDDGSLWMIDFGGFAPGKDGSTVKITADAPRKLLLESVLRQRRS